MSLTVSVLRLSDKSAKVLQILIGNLVRMEFRSGHRAGLGSRRDDVEEGCVVTGVVQPEKAGIVLLAFVGACQSWHAY